MGFKMYLPRNMQTNQDLKSAEAAGRKVGKPVGSHIGDLVDLRKTVILCDSCSKGFNPDANHYVQHRLMPIVRSNCDACRAFSHSCKCFSPEELV